MKRIILFAFALLAVLTAGAQQSFTIKGKAPEGITELKLYSLNGNQHPIADIAVNSGTFTHTLKAEQGDLLAIGTGEFYLPFFADNDLTEFDLEARTVVHGSEVNRQVAAIDARFDALQSAALKPIEAKAQAEDSGPEVRKALQKEVEEAYKEVIAQQVALLKECADQLTPAAFLRGMMYEMSYEDLAVLAASDRPYYNLPCMNGVKRYVSALEKKRPGLAFTDVALKDMQDRPVKLSDYVGKGNYVLIDFWASWCGPCRREMPTVVESYKQYHDKGYEIVGVSLDNNGDAWKQAVKAMGMSWPQMSDLKGWQCAAAAPYGVMSIPSNVLVDPQGVIIAADLRGQDLLNKLAEIYDK